MNILFNFIKRILLYQILIYYSFSKFDNIINSQKEFLKLLYTLLSDLGFNNLRKFEFPEDEDIIFRIILISIITISLLSIFNFSAMKFISGLISISIGFIYYNPFKKTNGKIINNMILNSIIIDYFIPSFDFLVFISSGIAMIYQAIHKINLFYYILCCCFWDDCENEGKRKNKRKIKIYCQFEYDINSNNSKSTSI